MPTKTIAIIGAGNMGLCLLNGLIKNSYPIDKIKVADPSPEKQSQLKKLFPHLYITIDNAKSVEDTDIILLAIKPLAIPAVLSELKDIIQKQKSLILSIAAAVTVKIIQQSLFEKVAIVRAMPNTPAMLGCGATALFANQNVTSEQKNEAEAIMRAVGVVTWLTDEKQMDIVTALSGCGPAYFFLLMETLQAAAEKLGLPASTANLLTLETALGAANMALKNNQSTAELRKQVASPGGATEVALKVLEEAGIRDIFQNALTAARDRSLEIANILENDINK